MPGKTEINWTNLSWGLFSGCSRCAPECMNCYAEILAGTRLKESPRYKGLTVIRGDNKPHWTGEVKYWPDLLSWPIRTSKPALIFTNSMSDPFHESVPLWQRDQFFAAMLLGNQHIYQVLTKRPAEMTAYISDPLVRSRVFQEARALWEREFAKPTNRNPGGKPFPEEKAVWPLKHVWLGCSAGCQASADKYLPDLVSIPVGWLLWVSAEPLIGSMEFRPEWLDGTRPGRNFVQWVVCGGESGTKADARPMRLLWVEAIRDACKRHGIPYWYKQPGNWQEMSDYDRGRFLNDPELIAAAATTGDVCALNEQGKTVRGVLVGSETLRGGVPLFWYNREKHGDSTEREFPPFPDTFQPPPVEVHHTTPANVQEYSRHDVTAILG